MGRNLTAQEAEVSRKSRVKSPAFLMLILKEAQIIISDTLVKLVEKFAPLPFGVYLTTLDGHRG